MQQQQQQHHQQQQQQYISITPTMMIPTQQQQQQQQHHHMGTPTAPPPPIMAAYRESAAYQATEPTYPTGTKTYNTSAAYASHTNQRCTCDSLCALLLFMRAFLQVYYALLL